MCSVYEDVERRLRNLKFEVNKLNLIVLFQSRYCNRDLGILYNSKLCFHGYIDEIVSKAYQRINLLFRSFVSGNVCILTRAYITYVRPLLEYCSFIWSPYRICYIEKIEGIQRYFTRRVLKHVGLPYMERLSVLKLESLESLEVRRKRADLELCFKIIYGLCDLDTNDFFSLCIPPHR